MTRNFLGRIKHKLNTKFIVNFMKFKILPRKAGKKLLGGRKIKYY